jgi:hypothetical protein
MVVTADIDHDPFRGHRTTAKAPTVRRQWGQQYAHVMTFESSTIDEITNIQTEMNSKRMHMWTELQPLYAKLGDTPEGRLLEKHAELIDVVLTGVNGVANALARFLDDEQNLRKGEIPASD